VTLTERIWPIIKEWEALRIVRSDYEVIPCCADLDLFKLVSSIASAAAASWRIRSFGDCLQRLDRRLVPDANEWRTSLLKFSSKGLKLISCG